MAKRDGTVDLRIKRTQERKNQSKTLFMSLSRKRALTIYRLKTSQSVQ